MIFVNNVVVEKIIFPDGTYLFDDKNLKIKSNIKQIEILWRYEPNEEMILYYITKHLQNKYYVPIILNLPYVPNARMDRIKKDSEIFTLKWFCQFINDLSFDEVIIRDPHSNVTPAMIDNVIIEDINESVFNLINTILNKDCDIVVYPDEGAYKKYNFSFPYLFGIKDREWKNGQIISLSLHGKLPGYPFNALIIDDICSYGNTALYTAKELKKIGAKEIYLYITHCENSILKGDLINSGLINKIYTTDSIFTKEHELIEIL